MRKRVGVLAVVFSLLLGSLIVAADRSVESIGPKGEKGDETPVFQVGRHYYCLRELYGITERELKTTYYERVAALSESQLEAALKQYSRPSITAGASTRRSDRESLERELLDAYVNNLIEFSARMRILAEITDAIVAQHHIRLDDYFDLPVLEDAVKKRLAMLKYIQDHKDDPESADRRLYDEAKEKFDCVLLWEQWQNMRRAAKSKWEPVTQIDALDLSMKKDNYIVRGMLAHYLLKEACESGIYARRAADVVDSAMSIVTCVSLRGYSGSCKALDEVLSEVIDESGVIAQGGLVELKQWLERNAPEVIIEAKNVAMAELVKARTTPVIGEAINVAKGHYVVYGWYRKSTPMTATMPSAISKGVLGTNVGYSLAIDEWAPPFIGLREGWGPKIDDLAMLSIEGRLFCTPGVRVGKFVLKTYPNDNFAAVEATRAEYHELVLQAARISIKYEKKLADKLILSLERKVAASKSAAVRARYEKLLTDVRGFGDL